MTYFAPSVEKKVTANSIYLNVMYRHICEQKIKYNDLFEDHRKQKKITSLFKELIAMRKKLLDEDQQPQLDPCIPPLGVQRNSHDLQPCTDNYSFGK